MKSMLTAIWSQWRQDLISCAILIDSHLNIDMSSTILQNVLDNMFEIRSLFIKNIIKKCFAKTCLKITFISTNKTSEVFCVVKCVIQQIKAMSVCSQKASGRFYLLLWYNIIKYVCILHFSSRPGWLNELGRWI